MDALQQETGKQFTVDDLRRTKTDLSAKCQREKKSLTETTKKSLLWEEASYFPAD